MTARWRALAQLLGDLAAAARYLRNRERDGWSADPSAGRLAEARISPRRLAEV